MKKHRRFLVFLCDSLIFLGICIITILLSNRYGAYIPLTEENIKQFVLLYVCTVASQILFKNYESLWRYAESNEYLSLLIGAGVGFFTYEIVAKFVVKRNIPFIYLTVIASLWILGMLFVRFAYRLYRNKVKYKRGSHNRRTAIIGAGEAGVKLAEELKVDKYSDYDVVAYFDDDKYKIGKYIRGTKVYSNVDGLGEYIEKLKLTDIIVAISSLDDDSKKALLNKLSAYNGIKISILPNAVDILENKSFESQIRSVKIEDLLGREPVKLENKEVKEFINDKVVLVTGGGGSIGSELCRQIVKYSPKELIIVDIYENNAYDIQQELRRHNKDVNLRVEIASVRDSSRIDSIFDKYKPNVVFHAAAHKHVPLMEDSSQESIKNNVFGTYNVVKAAEKYNVEKFILISTDKAVNPTSVMGASKRICEMILQSQAGKSKTVFSAVRFGNVLGSNGSVVPLFEKQIEEGGPVTITDKRIIRYFMTIPEAASLVMEAAASAKSSELYVLDMGQPVKILDLAINLIKLSGHTPYGDIDIVETGLRPGEKLYEELLIAGRNVEQTKNKRIFIEHQPPIEENKLTSSLEALKEAASNEDGIKVVSLMKELVPNFKKEEIK